MFRVARVSKLVTAMAVLRLVDEGVVGGLGDVVVGYVEELGRGEGSGVRWGRVTVGDLLGNMAGVVDMCECTSGVSFSRFSLGRGFGSGADDGWFRWLW